MKVKEFIRSKGSTVFTIGPGESVLMAIQELVKNNIGALLVCDSSGVVVGIISERDLLKECAQRGTLVGSTKVKDVMTREVAITVPDDDLDYVIDIMTQKGIRHMPVMVGRKVEGMISARDIVKVQLEEFKANVRYLSDYIAGGYI